MIYTLFGILLGLLLLGLMMFLHELGHFLVGKKLGFKILEFNIFMGPTLLKRYKDGIRYALRLVPIGASVAFAGEGDEGETDEVLRERLREESAAQRRQEQETGAGEELDLDQAAKLDPDDPSLFFNRPKWMRALVLLAGPLINIVSGLLALVIFFSATGFAQLRVKSVEADSLFARAQIPVGAELLELDGHRLRNNLDFSYYLRFASEGRLELSYRSPEGQVERRELNWDRVHNWRFGIRKDAAQEGMIVASVDPAPDTAPADDARRGLKAGDQILRVAGQEASIESLLQAAQASEGEAVKLELLREGERLELELRPFAQEGLRPVGASFELSHSFWEALPYSWHYLGSIVRLTFDSIRQIFTGGIAARDAVSGPVGVVSMISGVVTASQISWADRALQLVYLFALISISLGIMNLLPIPPLDGFQLWVTAYEGLRGKSLSMKARQRFAVAGLVVIVALFVLGLFFDILRLSGI